jgi:hypothetical protein
VTVDPKTVPPVSLSEESRQPAEDGAGPGKPRNRGGVLSRSNVWLLRIRALLFVTLCATFGVLLIILPWTPKWTDNPVLLSMPNLRPIVSNGFFRGLCSGLGVLDLWLGFWEAIYYHEKPVDGGQ